MLTPPRPYPILNKLAAADSVRQPKNAEHQPEALPTQWQNNTPHWHNIPYKAQLLMTSAKRMAQLIQRPTARTLLQRRPPTNVEDANKRTIGHQEGQEEK